MKTKNTLKIFVLAGVILNNIYAQTPPKGVPPIEIELAKNEEIIANQTGEYALEGVASYYAEDFHEKLTANGESFNMNAYTAAHRTLPFNSVVKVTNLDNNASVVVRINDRGPYLKNRIIDLSKKAAIDLGMRASGTANVKLEVLHLGKKKLAKIHNIAGVTNYLAHDEVSIQIASYQNVENAKQLVETLSKHDFECTIIRYDNYFRVILDNVSPESVNDELEKLRKIGFSNVIVRDKTF